LPFVKLAFALFVLAASLLFADIPPYVHVDPQTIPAGSGDTVVTVSGARVFNANMQVRWNGRPLTTRFVNQWSLKVSLSAADLAQPGLFWISLWNAETGSRFHEDMPVFVYLPLQNLDVVKDQSSGRLYVALARGDPHSPGVAVVDPALGVVERYIPLPYLANTIAVSATGRYLFAGTREPTGYKVRRVDLTAIMNGSEIVAKSETEITSILALPDAESSFIFANSSNGILVEGSTSHLIGGELLKCVTAIVDGVVLGAPGFQRIESDETGQHSTTRIRTMTEGRYCPAFGGGLLYGGDGDVVDPKTATRVGRLDGSGMVDVAPERNRVYFVGPGNARMNVNGNAPSVLVFDLTTRQRLKSVPIPTEISGVPGRLVHWGADGLAFGFYRNFNAWEADGLVLLRTSDLP
jgi:hypothetical protein